MLPVLDPQDKSKVIYVVAEGRDIMEKKKAEAEIVRKNQELQELYDKIKVKRFMKSALGSLRSLKLIRNDSILSAAILAMPRNWLTHLFHWMLILQLAKLLIKSLQNIAKSNVHAQGQCI